ncbi:hypothetical protein ACSJLP_13065 [Gordonia rhizosphera NBRC 16068]|uniref:hypothetical protein n=1 Tax=Gordonia rhizosphera TaxID=83341 RepID=UPI00031C37B6
MASRPSRQAQSAEDQELFQGLRHALRSDEPIDLLMSVSGLVAVTDPRNRDPFSRDEPGLPTLSDLVESFIGTPYAETTAALTIIRALATDEVLAARIGRELATRRHPMPDWLAGLDRARIEPNVWFMTHVLGDGDDYLLGITLPSGHALSALVYVDHNLGTVVKDAFVVPAPLEDLVIQMGGLIDDPDQSLTRTDAATARAMIDEAIDLGSRMYPPLESESWPMCRPLIEWMVRMLPSGGVATQRQEWSEEDKAAIAEDFFASPFGKSLDRDDERSLMDSLLWFGTDYTNGDPFRWSTVTVEILLVDWFPRKVVAEPAYLAKLPNLLRAFIRYAHDREGIRASLTEDTLTAVDEYEPDYQRVIRSSRPQGPTALLAGLLETGDLEGFDGFGNFDDKDFDDEDALTIGEIMLEGLDRKVGGRPALVRLDDLPLPDEPFEWSGVADDIVPVVREVLAACDACADELLDVEHRTAMRRFLRRSAVGDPAIFRRKASPARGAAAVAWVVCRANNTAGAYWSGLTVQDLLAWFGVKGSVSQRAEPMLRANGVDPHRLYGQMDLGAADLLTSTCRASIITTRDRHLLG